MSVDVVVKIRLAPPAGAFDDMIPSPDLETAPRAVMADKWIVRFCQEDIVLTKSMPYRLQSRFKLAD